jgi:hypothetical protein
MLSEMKDLIDELAKYDKINISADKFAEMLISLGFKDLTEYKRPEISEAKVKKINFADSKYKPLFSINDGEEIEIEIAGEWERAVCIYIDDYHFRLGGAGGLVYHIHEFSMNMATYNRRFRSVTKA